MSMAAMAPARPLRLRPLWIGFVLVVLKFAGEQGARYLGSDQPSGVLLLGASGLATLGAIVYYFMCVHRLIRLLGTQPDWQCEYTPAGVV
jgi:hypothetical protein